MPIHGAIGAPDQTLDALATLAAEIEGELRLDPLHRLLYATDASLYAQEPLGVVYPKHALDIERIVRCAAAYKIPLIPRTAGTSLAGQCVGAGLVVDVSKHMRAVLEVNEAERWVRVQPGVILDELNHILKPTGLMFGPDTSTSNRCMIGGMIGNNSCGSHSILYGNTMAHTLEVEVVLSDGTRTRWGALTPAQVEDATQRDGIEGCIYRVIKDVITEQRQELLARFPKPELTRRNMAYPLDDLARSQVFDPDSPKPFSLARFLCGTEGTLAFTTEAKLNLVPRPKAIQVLASHFDTIDAALRATVVAVRNNPAAVELIDKRTLDASAGNLEQQRNRVWLDGDPGAVLVIEFYRDTPDEAKAAADATAAQFEAEGWGYSHKLLSPSQTNMAWELRKAGLGALMGIAGDVKPITFVEDTAVAVEDLPDYIRDFTQIMARYQTECVYYAHASVGELHLRPELNPKDISDMEKMKAIASEVAALVRRYQGTISGEHGDGRVRSPFIREVLGDAVVAALARVKGAFDPLNIMNPGKIVDPAPIDADLRYPPGRPVPTIPTFFSFPEDDGLLRAVERCNGAGACRKLVFSGGTMCPSYMVTLDERHTTRGRANAFRMLLLGEHSPEKAWASQEVYEAMDLCLGCKGCKSECPASVDMAKLKSEFLQHHYDVHGTPRRAEFFGDPLNGYKLAQSLSKLVNPSLKTPIAKKAMQTLFGVHPKRDLPGFAPKTLRQLLAKRPPSQAPAPHGDVLLYIDMFTDYHDPHVGVAAVELLEMAGYRVLTIPHPYSGRTQISKGLLRKARALAVENVLALRDLARQGTPILGIEPSEILSLIDEIPDLVPDDLRADALMIAAQVCLVDNFIARRAESNQLNGLTFRDPDPGPRKVLVHGHCHQKALVGLNPTLQALRLVQGWQVEAIPSGCCGMAGSFGYEEEHYDVSMAVGELVLFPAVRKASDALLIAPGVSCRHQIYDGTQRAAIHPIEALRATACPATS
jgi:FAD/FMN-containing dehydrogenase/Fe-S oxidoreductase